MTPQEYEIETVRNAFLIELKSAYDMPTDAQYGHQTMPSIYCETFYGKTPSLDGGFNKCKSKTCVSNRNPVWNEQLLLTMFDYNLERNDDEQLVF